jgi:hypothetical protein
MYLYHQEGIVKSLEVYVAVAERSAPAGRLGFHIPPNTSVDHLHLHVQGLPYRSIIKQAKYPVSPGTNGRSKGYGWFVEVEQLTRILGQGGQVKVWPC